MRALNQSMKESSVSCSRKRRVSTFGDPHRTCLFIIVCNLNRDDDVSPPTCCLGEWAPSLTAAFPNPQASASSLHSLLSLYPIPLTRNLSSHVWCSSIRWSVQVPTIHESPCRWALNDDTLSGTAPPLPLPLPRPHPLLLTEMQC
jgi:hypothetical protein